MREEEGGEGWGDGEEEKGEEGVDVEEVGEVGVCGEDGGGWSFG